MRILLARGARHAERLTLDAVDAILPAVPDPAELARPVRIVVPSRSLRRHLVAALLRRRGRAAVGLVVQSHRGLAWEALRRTGATVVPGDALLPVMAARAAHREPALRRVLGGLDDGYRAAASSLRDLLDAGFEPVHAEAMDELLAVDGHLLGSRDEVRRARALTRAASALYHELETRGVDVAARLLRRAREAIADDPERALPACGLVVHGYADVTGVVGDLLETVLRAHDGTAIVDQPPDPRREGDRDHRRRERAFTIPLLLRLATLAAPEEASPTDDRDTASPELALLATTDPAAESRAVARRLRRLLDDGACPESIAVVARDLDPWAIPLRAAFAALGIPFSGVGGRGPLTPAGRRLRSLFELLRRGPRLPLERWLELVDERPVPRGRLRTALYARGLARLEDVARLEVPDTFGEKGLASDEDVSVVPDTFEEVGGEMSSPFEDESMVPDTFQDEGAEVPDTFWGGLGWAATAAWATMATLERWRDAGRMDLTTHREHLESLIDERLGWASSSPARELLDAVWEGVEQAAAGAPGLELDEFVTVVEELAGDSTRVPVGGAGGGVQMLSVIEARGRTFAHLFVVGLVRDVFPRPAVEDALLRDRLRRGLRRLLPDLRLARRGFDEDRFLFAQLLSASPRTTLVWHAEDAMGRPRALSPLVEPLLRDHGPATAEGADTGDGATLDTLDEHLHHAALHGPRDVFEPLLALALDGARRELATIVASSALAELAPVTLAGVRRRILDELDPDLETVPGRTTRSRLGPYLGLIGPAVLPDDPRRRPPAVTVLESLAACPWQTFLRRFLRLRPVADPLAALPELGPALTGRLVHRVLEAIARPRVAGEPARWPSAAVLQGLLTREARRLVAESGFGPGAAGLARAAAARARPFVEAAVGDWHPPPEVVGAELPFVVTASARGGARGAAVAATIDVARAAAADAETPAGTGRPVRLRADRVDRRRGGGLRLTDYKTGTPFAAGKSSSARRRALLAAVAAGRRLQVAAYLRVKSTDGGAAEGRYLFLRPELADEDRVLAAASHDRALERAWHTTAATLLSAWDAGVFFPRLVAPDDDVEPPLCSRCPVAEACPRRDSGSRIRLREWAAAATETPSRTEPASPPPSWTEPSSPSSPSSPPSWTEPSSPGIAAITSVEGVLLELWRLPLAARGEEGES